MGKPVSEAYGIELRAVVTCLRWYAEAADKQLDESPRTASSSLALVTREPVGVVAAVVPWNFPLTMAAWKLAPALAAGCAAVLKPAEESPLSALHLAALATEAGLPPGVLNVVNGPGEVAGRALGEHPGVDVLAFTGSTEVGRHFLRYAADSNLKRVWLELGGKPPNIILPDAPDLDAAADTAAWGIFFNAGEMCTAPSRLLVHRSVSAQVVDRIVARAESPAHRRPARPGHGDGPARLRRAPFPRPRAHQGRAVRRRPAARGRQGGRRVHLPTVFDQVKPGMRVAREEIFGPVLAVLEFDHVDMSVPFEALYDVDAEQDEFDLALAAHALEAGIPTLAVCRGLQIVNTVLGGTLNQHMPQDHRNKVHSVNVKPGTLLAKTLDTEETAASCYHHQSIATLAPALTPTAFGFDGTIEGAELAEPGHWFLAVQWHPEDTAATDRTQQSLFNALVQASGRPSA